MTQADLPEIERIGDRVHPDYPEDAAILAERQRLYPPGCFAFGRDPVQGYAVSHPWRLFHPPKLNTKLHHLPDHPDTYYIHDVALLPEARGVGSAVIPLLVAQAERARVSTISLVAVGNSLPFWTKHGFEPADTETIRAALASYDADARYMLRPLDR